MAAIVSSLDLINVGPNTTPRLLACIKFCFALAATLSEQREERTTITAHANSLSLKFGQKTANNTFQKKT